MRICSTQFRPILAASKSDPYKKYEVLLRPVDSRYPKCSCVAFAMARNRARKGLVGQNADVETTCKHIKEALKTACMWTGEGGVCDNCGAETVEEGTRVEVEAIVPVEGPAPVTGMPELRPMLAQEVAAEKIPKFSDDNHWWAEQKIDGHRVLIHVYGGELMVLGRSGQRSQHASRFEQPDYSEIKSLPACVIDGELVGDDFWIFDMPHCASRGITTDSPYRERREQLEKLFVAWAPTRRVYRLLPTAKTASEKAELAVTVFKAGGEGLMFKDLSGTYRPGNRSSNILKAKFVKTAEVIVTKVGSGGKENYTLSVYRNGKLVEVGRCSAIGKAAVQAGAVIEVKYLYLAAEDRLYQPRMMRVRTDKSAEECLWSQFDHARVNKSVLS